MENGQEANKTEEKSDAKVEEVKVTEKPATKTAESEAKEDKTNGNNKEEKESNKSEIIEPKPEAKKRKFDENNEKEKDSEEAEVPESEAKKQKTDGIHKDEKEPEKPKIPEATPELLEKIKKQVEFYFGDVNMQKDKFLIEQTKLSEGWIPMDVMLKFKALVALSEDSVTIVKALESSELVETSEDKTKIRRSLDHPLPVYDDEYRKAQQARTIYAKGFPLEGMTIEKLKTFLEAFEPIENIHMRKYADKEKKMHFKGSIFVQFKTLDAAKVFMDKEAIKYGETELIRRWAADYNAEKQKEKEDRRQKKTEQKDKKSPADQQDKEEEEKEEKEKETPTLPKGAVLHFSGIENGNREDIREALTKLDAHIAYVDYTRGNESGYVRLSNENEAKNIFEKLNEGKIKLGEKEVIVRVLEGDEEDEYLLKMERELAEMRKGRNKQNKFKGGKKGRFQQRGQKRKGGDNGYEGPRKKRSG